MANEERGEMKIVLEDVEYGMRPSHDAIVAIEAATGRGLVALARDALRAEMTLGVLSQVACECIRAWGKATNDPAAAAFSAKRVAEVIVEAGPQDAPSDDPDKPAPASGVLGVMARVAAMLALAVNGGFTSAGEPKAVGKNMPGTPTAG